LLRMSQQRQKKCAKNGYSFHEVVL
jgi:hypothetical protein